jgi:hypothetical protein
LFFVVGMGAMSSGSLDVKHPGGLGRLPGNVIHTPVRRSDMVETVLYDKRDRIAFVTLNRPEAKNAIDPGMHDELSHLEGFS